MTKPAICPVCNGSGVRHIPPAIDSSGVEGTYVACNGCMGKGWVEVSEDICIRKEEDNEQGEEG